MILDRCYQLKYWYSYRLTELNTQVQAKDSAMEQEHNKDLETIKSLQTRWVQKRWSKAFLIDLTYAWYRLEKTLESHAEARKEHEEKMINAQDVVEVHPVCFACLIISLFLIYLRHWKDKIWTWRKSQMKRSTNRATCILKIRLVSCRSEAEKQEWSNKHALLLSEIETLKAKLEEQTKPYAYHVSRSCL